MATCEGVIFDLDGTLLDSLDDLADSMNAVLQGHGLPTHPVEAYRFFVGDGIARLVERALPEQRREPEFLKTCVEQMKARYDAGWAAKTRPYPGIEELLGALSLRTVPCAILSNKPDAFTQVMVKTLLKPWRFAVVRGELEGVPRKPDPRGALLVCEQLGIEPQRVAFVGDSGVDMQTAVAAGLLAVGVTWGFRPVAELKEQGAQKICAQPRDLLPLFLTSPK
jgi:phosphoglycolate phosphatase